VKVRTAIGGSIAAVVGVAILGATGWQPLGGREPSQRPVQPTPDQRLYVLAKLSVENDTAFDATWSVNGVVPEGVGRVGLTTGWAYSGTAWQRQFGPFTRGDHFLIITLAPRANLLAWCAAQTVGKPQRRSHPYTVVGKDGKATCQLDVGD